AENNGSNEYRGEATAAPSAPKKEVSADLKLIARSAQYHTLLSMTKVTIPAIIQKASAQGTVFSVKEKIRNGRPVFEVMTAQGNNAKTTFYDLVTGEPTPADVTPDPRFAAMAHNPGANSDRAGAIKEMSTVERLNDEASDRFGFDAGHPAGSCAGTRYRGGRDVIPEMPALP